MARLLTESTQLRVQTTIYSRWDCVPLEGTSLQLGTAPGPRFDSGEPGDSWPLTVGLRMMKHKTDVVTFTLFCNQIELFFILRLVD